MKQVAKAELKRLLWQTESLPNFIQGIEYGVVPAAHHIMVCKKLEQVMRGEIKRLMLFLPPGSAKSTYASVLFPPFYFGYHPSRSIIAASHTSELAERFGRKVRNIVAMPEYRRMFDIGLAEDSQAAGRWDTSKGGEYYAVGVGGAVLGRRADLGIIDDPIKGREEADSDLQRDKVWEWYKSDFYTRLKPDAAVVLIMQRWHEDDLAGRLLMDAQEGGEQWEVLSLPMEAKENDPLGRRPGEILWPEWYKPEMVEQAKRDARYWSSMYQQEPRPESGGEFKKADMQYYSGALDHARMNKYILCDPAGEKNKGSDYTSFWVVGLGHDENYYVVDIIRDKLNLTERADTLFRLHRKYKPMQVRYEKYGMMADIEHFKDRMSRENYRFQITEVAGATPKRDRIRRLVPLFERQRMYFPESLFVTDHRNMAVDLIHAFREQELAAFPVGVHDDMIDSLSRIAEPDLPLTWPSNKNAGKLIYPNRGYG